MTDAHMMPEGMRVCVPTFVLAHVHVLTASICA